MEVTTKSQHQVPHHYNEGLSNLLHLDLLGSHSLGSSNSPEGLQGRADGLPSTLPLQVSTEVSQEAHQSPLVHINVYLQGPDQDRGAHPPPVQLRLGQHPPRLHPACPDCCRHVLLLHAFRLPGQLFVCCFKISIPVNIFFVFRSMCDFSVPPPHPFPPRF